METGNTIVLITLIMMAYVLLAAMVDYTYQTVDRVSPPAKSVDAPSILTAFVLFIVPLILAALIGAVERQYIAWCVGSLPPYARDIS
jgi:quinol-cytochrome oxidoreductase complex cytochrome b subunit